MTSVYVLVFTVLFSNGGTVFSGYWDKPFIDEESCAKAKPTATAQIKERLKGSEAPKRFTIVVSCIKQPVE